MTRIVSGVWGGRRLKVPSGRTVRPTAERVREAWLSILAPELRDARLLDLFAGTGALGLEALSRGADHCTFVENHSASLSVLRQSITALDAAERTTVRRADAIKFLDTVTNDAYDIILADPPFASDDAVRVVQWWTNNPSSRVLAVEHDPRTIIDGGNTRRWGDVAVTFLRKP